VLAGVASAGSEGMHRMNGTTGGQCEPLRRSRRRLGLLAAVAAGVAVFAAACGGSGGGPAGPAGASHPPGYRQYHAYSACMRAHGAPFWPEPSVVPAGVWDNPYAYKVTPQILAAEHGQGWQAALTACKKVAPRQLPYTAAQISVLRSQLQQLAACMRAHGITHFPSPAAGAYGAGFPSPGPGVNPNSAQFQAAQRTCWRYAPGSERKAA
jgi:hypothetical protein